MTEFPAWALPWLRCPHCGGGLDGGPGGDEGADPGSAPRSVPGPSVVGCPAGHRFDVARHGYLPLLGPRARTDTADDAAMVAARAAFLAGGWYRPIVEAVSAALAGIGPGPVVEVGAGTGYYLAAVVAGPGEPGRGVGAPGAGAGERRGLALDSSKYALRRAARSPGVAAVLADAWSALPVVDGVAAGALSVFAPRDPTELVRVVAPGGRIVVVTPEVDHLAELRGPLPLLGVDAGKAQRVVQAFAGLPVTAMESRAVRYAVALPRRAVTALVAMGPTARHLTAGALNDAVAALAEPVRVTVAVTVTTVARPPQ